MGRESERGRAFVDVDFEDLREIHNFFQKKYTGTAK